jgi:ribosomal protein L25 (general stress protein Ctc)
MLEGIIRESTDKKATKALRKDGYLIANIYGKNKENINAAFKENEFIKSVRNKETLAFDVKVGDNTSIKGSPISWMYWGWLILGIAVPFVLFLSKSKGAALIGAISALIGTFLMRQAFIYGGNIVPMTERVDGLGPQSTTTYVNVTPWAYIPPHTMEILIIIGCLGLGIAIYAILDKLFDVRNVTDSYDHH